MCLEFLGIILDTHNMEIRLSEERVGVLATLLKQWQNRKRCRKRQLLSLIGKLAHACKVVRVGRIFLRRLINLSTHASKLHHWLHISEEVQADLAWWVVFLPSWNHRTMMYSSAEPQSPEIIFASDASGDWGCGACWGNSWIQLPWTEEWLPVSIAAKELIPIVLACAVWGKQWQGKHVLVWSDNMSVVLVITGLSSRDPLLTHLLRLLYFFLATHSIPSICQVFIIPLLTHFLAISCRCSLSSYQKQILRQHPSPTSSGTY